MPATIQKLRTLCQGDAERIAGWMYERDWRWTLACVVTIVAGSGAYGFTVGLWRAPLQAVFTALKFPALILLTCGANALVNGMLAQLLGAGLTFRQTTLAILMSFTIASVVLASLAPVTLFLLWNTPPLAEGTATVGHSVTLLAHVGIIAYAGTVSTTRLFRLLTRLTGSRAVSAKVMLSWLAGNLFLGAQLSWVLRPFIGSPGLPVQLLRDEPLRGNFFAAVLRAIELLFS